MVRYENTQIIINQICLIYQKAFGFKDCSGLDRAMERLRSSVWSSETLLEGMKKVSSQPSDFVKAEDESDQELVAEFKASFL